MRVKLTGRSHNPADPSIPRFDLQIPNGDSIIAELDKEQAAWLRADPSVLVEPAPDPEPEPAPAEGSDQTARPGPAPAGASPAEKPAPAAPKQERGR